MNIVKEHIYFVNAHPDDLNAGLGLALILKDLAQYQLHIIDFTKGERGLKEEGVGLDECAAIRIKEETSVCAELGVKPVFLREIDGDSFACRETCNELAAVFRAEVPKAVITHWPLDIHQDHVMCAAATTNAIRLAEIQPELYFYRQSMQSRHMPEDYFIPFGREIMDRKCELLKLYACQKGEEIASRQRLENTCNGIHNHVEFAECFAAWALPLPGQPCFFEDLAKIRRKVCHQ